MGWQDRDYNRTGGGRTISGPLEWVLYGQVKLFRAFGIEVRAHASLIILIGIVLLLGLGPGSTLLDRVESMTALFAIVLLHEFGHCFTARWVGGQANLIVMHPLGGLAFAQPPRRPLPTFLTVAGGPAVNVVICAVCAAALYFTSTQIDWNPLTFTPPRVRGEHYILGSYLFWIFSVSQMLLVFNLLPVYPLDGGQMLQSILWPRLGYYRSMLLSCQIGMVGAVILGLYGLWAGSILLVMIMVSGFLTCMSLRRQLLAAGPALDEPDNDGIDYSAAYEQPGRRPKANVRAQKQIQKLAEQERQEQQTVDAILAKVSSQGMQSLSWTEKRTLKKATENQRKRDAARTAARKRSLGA